MNKTYLGLWLGFGLALGGCLSGGDSSGATDDETRDDGESDDNAADDGESDGSDEDDPPADDSSADDSSTDDSSADDSSTDDSSADDGSADDSSTDDSSADDSSADDSSADDPATSASAQDLPSIPDDCEQYSVSASQTYCEQRYTCTADSLYSACSQTGDQWDCSCNNSTRSLSLSLAGATSSEACTLAVRSCLSDVPLSYNGDTTCSPYSQSANTSSCDYTLQCDTSAELGDGVSALSSEYHTAYCSGDGAGTWSCSCQTGTNSQSHTLTGTDVAPCEASLELCTSDQELSFTNEEECQPNSQSSTDTYCSLNETCTREADAGGGVTALLSSSRSVSCEAGASAWSCQCSTDQGGPYRFEFDPGADPLLACPDASAFCANIGSQDLDGPVDCETTSQSSNTSGCEVRMDCAQTTELDGTAISVVQPLMTYCSQSSEGVYQCQCSTNNDTSTFELESDATPFETCSLAAERCLESTAF